MDYFNHYESFSRRIFGHLMRLDQLLVRETNVMDYSHLYLFFAIIQLLFFLLLSEASMTTAPIYRLPDL